MNILIPKLKLICCIVILPFIFSCGGDSGGDSDPEPPTPTNIETSVAVDAANEQIAQIIRTSAGATAGVGADSEALASGLELLGISLAVNDEDGGISDNLIEVMDGVLDADGTNISREGDVINIEPEAQPICDEFSMLLGFAKDDQPYTACLNVIHDMLVQIDIKNEEEGELEVHYDGLEALSVTYSPQQLIVSVDLGSAAQVLAQVMPEIDPEVEAELPDTVSGGVAMTIKNLGEEHGSMQFDITSTIQLIDEDEGYNISLAPATLMSMEANGLAGTAQMSSNISQLNALFPMEIDDDGNMVDAQLLLSSAQMMLEVEDAGDSLNLELDLKPLRFLLDGSEILALSLSAPEIEMTEEMAEITMASAMELDLSLVDEFELLGGMEGELSISSSANTQMREQGEGIYELQSGSIEIEGTGTFSELSSYISSGYCMNLLQGQVDCP